MSNGLVVTHLVDPHIIAARNLLLERWHPRNSTALGGESVMIFYGQSGPWRDKCDSVVAKVLQCVPGLEVMVNTPIGLVPYTLEDLNPFCHIEGPDWIWKNKFDNVKIAQELELFGLSGRSIIPINLRSDNFESEIFESLSQFNSEINVELVEGQITITDQDLYNQSQLHLNRLKAADKFSVLFNVSQEIAIEMTSSMEFVVNKYGRIKNILSASGKHLASFRLGDGGMSLNNAGAIELFARRRRELPSGFSKTAISPYCGEGLAVVVVDNDAEPFVRKGRNVFHGFTIASDPWLRPGEPCLICNQSGQLIGHGVSVSTADDLSCMKKGVAVKTRDGIKEGD